ncbi:MAG: hypothetical protein JJ863_04960 [Deltaproteobacteria bacterium]|nr:hypothetical protein [Deltaproteobacteria bacterium]
MLRLWTPTLLSSLLALATLGACGDDDSDGTTDAGFDMSLPVDAGTDMGSMPDSGPGDLGVDAAPDLGPELAPIFRNEVSTEDEALALEALAILRTLETATEATCPGCYEVSRANIRALWDQTMAAWETCFADLDLLTPEAAEAALECFQTEEAYDRDNLGVFATGAHFEWFAFAFRRALGADWEDPHATFVEDVQIPSPPETLLTHAEFDTLTEWFLRGTPFIERQLPHLQPRGTCETFVDASVALMAEEGETIGWPARNEAAAMLMHDCPTAGDPLACLTSYPEASDTTPGTTWNVLAGSTTRVLFEVPYDSSYWTKVSPSGRFVAHGGGVSTGASIVDLSRDLSIGVDASFDPGFFPDGSGFMFQGGGTKICQTTVLTSGDPTSLTLTEPGCTSPSGIGLYQHVGASLDGDDYWVVDSVWDGDPGGSNSDPQVSEQADASLNLYRLLNTGSGFEQAGEFFEQVPFEASAVIAPTMRTVVTQIGDGSGTPIGYVLRRIDLTRDGTGAVTDVRLPEVARYCYPGGKAALSLDDRFIVTHHRATDEDARDLGFFNSDDPGFAPYRGISNIYLIDLVTGERTRISHVAPGQRALFPSFRSDGWIYYLVRTGSLPEYIVATDAAIVAR